MIYYFLLKCNKVFDLSPEKTLLRTESSGNNSGIDVTKVRLFFIKQNFFQL